MRLIRARQAVAGVYLPLAGGTMTGDIQLWAQSLRTVNLLLRQIDADTLVIQETTGAAVRNLSLQALLSSYGIIMQLNAARISANNADAEYMILMARDSGVGQVEIARLQGAADAYFQATLPLRLLPIATVALPGTPVEGMVTYDDTRKRIVLRNNTAWVSTMDAHTAGDVLLASANTEGSNPPIGATLKKTIVMPGNGTFRIKMDLVSGAVGDGMVGQVYRNGVAVGGLNTENGMAYATWSEDIAGWFSGDLCQLYVRYGTNPNAGSKWKNFRIYAAVDLTNYTVTLDT